MSPSLWFQAFSALSLFKGASATSTPDNVSSRLQVQIPRSLFKSDGYDHREALFGSPPYGGSITQTLYYADSDLCDPNVDKTKGYPIRDDKSPWPSPFILMVDRGSCSFVQKARNAQHAGAAGVIFADNVCVCGDTKCTDENSKEGLHLCQPTEPIMADDGSGGDIDIPAFLMFKSDADKLKEQIMQNVYMQIEMSWSLPHPDDTVEYELWTVPSEVVSKDFQKNWKQISKVFDHRITFTPRQYIYDGLVNHCHKTNGESMCFNLCTNNGRYCAVDPDMDLEHGISGADVVTESLRRICVWEAYGKEDGVGEKYWDYIYQFLERCDTPDFFARKKCIDDVYKNAKIDGKLIDECMEREEGLEGDHEITLLKEEIDEAVQRGVVVIPTVFVNNVPLRGSLTSSTVVHAICAGFAEGSAPDICSVCSSCSDAGACVLKGSCPGKSSPFTEGSGGSVSKRFFGLTLLTVCCIFGAVGYLHWKKTREEMRDQVRGILAEYMPLEGGEDAEGRSPMDFARQGGTQSLIS